jgi:hypothetical protein
MKTIAAIFCLVACSSMATAQSPDPSKWMCRNLADSGGFTYQGETIVGTQACRPIPQAAVAPPASKQENTTPTSAPAPTTEAYATTASADPNSALTTDTPSAAASTAASVPSTSASTASAGPLASGAVIAIAPMGGFDTYLAAAIREKKTPVQLTVDPAQSAFLLVSSEYEWHGWFANSYGGASGSANWNHNGGSANYNAASASNAGTTRGLEASLMLVDKQTGRVLWAYEVHKSSHGSLIFGTLGMRGQQSVAEACAKHLKEYIEKGKG